MRIATRTLLQIAFGLSASFAVALTGDRASSELLMPDTNGLDLAAMRLFAQKIAAANAPTFGEKSLRFVADTRRAWTGIQAGVTAELVVSPTWRLKISSKADPDVWIELEDGGRNAAKPVIRNNVAIVSRLRPAVDALVFSSGDEIEDLRVVHQSEASIIYGQKLRFGPGVREVRLRDGAIEVLDREARVRLSASPTIAVDASGKERRATLRLHDGVLETRIDTAALVFPIVIDPAWTAHGALPINGTLEGFVLKDGRVAAAAAFYALKVVVIDPASSAIRTMPLCEGFAFEQPTFTLLPNARVLATDKGYASMTLDLATEKCTPTPNHAANRGPYEVLAPTASGAIAFGGNSNTDLEVFDDATGTWATVTGARINALKKYGRADVWAIPLRGTRAGDLLVLGTGASPSMYHAASKTVSAIPPPKSTIGYAVTALADGRALIVGGGDATAPSSAVEIFDPETSTWSTAPGMTTPRADASATLLTDGNVLVVGGVSGSGVLKSTELFDVNAAEWHAAAPMGEARSSAGLLALSGGRALVFGGLAGPSPLSSVELYSPLANGAACATADDCASTICASGKCASSCTTSSDCAAGRRCADGKCVAGEPNGVACSRSDECASGYCAISSCCDKACFPYGCDSRGCRTSCASSDQCAKGFACVGGECKPQLGCSSSTDCEQNQVCTSEGRCVETATSAADDGGCAVVRAGRAATHPCLYPMLAVLVALRRRRPARA